MRKNKKVHAFYGPHCNKVSWLVMWTDNIQGNNKYIMLNASSRVKVRFYFFHFI